MAGPLLLPQAVGWYGKLPSRGDFVGRGLPRPWQRTWDDWLQRGLALAAQRLGGATLRERLLAMPPWHAIVLPAEPAQPTWCLVVAPAADRIGRAYPLLLAEAYDAAALDGAGVEPLQARALQLADWLDRIGALASPRAFDAGAAALAATGWPGAPRAGNDGAATLAALRHAWPAAASFWWCTEPVADMFSPHAEAWPPRDALLLDWLGAAG